MGSFETIRARTLSAERSAVQDVIRGREISTTERGYAVGRMGHGAADVLVADKGHTAKPSPWAGVTGREIGRALVVSGRAAKPARAERIPELIAREVIASAIGDAAPAEDNDELPTLQELGIGDAAGTQDSEPAVSSWYCGRPFSEGRKAHNAWLVSHGRGPIPDGRR